MGASLQATTMTLEQRRAADAWRCAQGQPGEYAKLAKGLPALIMNSGLLQVMAFLQEKGGSDSQAHCRVLGEQLRRWLNERYPKVRAEFNDFMQDLMSAEPATFREVTAEAFAWLRWVRQVAPVAGTRGR